MRLARHGQAARSVWTSIAISAHGRARQTGGGPLNLFELPELCATAPALQPNGGVPSWTLGCFRRRAITFFTGTTDTTTRALWLQTHGLTADLRLSTERPHVESLQAVQDCSLDELVLLAKAEGGLAQSVWSNDEPGDHEPTSGVMQWHDWTSFQLHAKWPEPGLLRRVGDCLIEFAPSGAYVEDWRFQLPGPGPLIGLRLVDERDAESGAVLHRGGGLVVCGRHAAFVRGRPQAPQGLGRLSQLLQGRDLDALTMLFACDASYGKLSSRGSYTVAASTLPWREGCTLLSLDGFSYDAQQKLIVQETEEDERRVLRRFEVDTLEPSFDGSLATGASESGVSWLEQEADTLLPAAETPGAPLSMLPPKP